MARVFSKQLFGFVSETIEELKICWSSKNLLVLIYSKLRKRRKIMFAYTNFTFSLTACGSEERRTTACGL